jgi:hypothetical protein
MFAQIDSIGIWKRLFFTELYKAKLPERKKKLINFFLPQVTFRYS